VTNRSVLAGDGIAYAGSKLKGDDQERPHACLEGVVCIGRLVDEDGEEVEIFGAVPCRKRVAGEEA
jgi:hypothetical protein